MTMSADLAAWLLEQIAEDERVARAVSSPAPWVIDDQQRDDRAIYGAARGATVAYDPSGDEESRRDFAHIVRWDPARVLAECAAKRQIIELHGEQHDCTDPSAGVWPYVGCDTLRLLALPYADREGYREEWRP